MTDAAVVMGLLDPDFYLGGRIRLNAAVMAQAIRTLSVERGVDPRRLWLVGFGGAGPLFRRVALCRTISRAEA